MVPIKGNDRRCPAAELSAGGPVKEIRNEAAGANLVGRARIGQERTIGIDDTGTVAIEEMIRRLRHNRNVKGGFRGRTEHA